LVCPVGSVMGSWDRTVGAAFLGRPRAFFVGMASGIVASAAASSSLSVAMFDTASAGEEYGGVGCS
jgi:hypothetical protein